MYFVSMKKRNRYEYLKMGPAGVKEKVGGGGEVKGRGLAMACGAISFVVL